VRLPVGTTIAASKLSWRVTPGGATNLVTCGIEVWRDGAQFLSAMRESTAGSSAETVLGSAGMTVETGSLPYTVQTNDLVWARFTATGAGSGERKAWWFAFNHAG
jgi:hypothetical protein